MKIKVLVVLFFILYFINNLLYLELVERVFNSNYGMIKRLSFGLISGTAGTVMLMLFESMSALGYTIMLIVYLLTVFFHYSKQGTLSKVFIVLQFNLHIMATRAIASSLYSLISGRSIYELSEDLTSFWIILILTTITCIIISTLMITLIPRKFFSFVTEKTGYLKLNIVLLTFANVYFIINGNVYIYEIDYWLLQLDQIIGALCWLAASYSAIFMLVGIDIIRKKRETLEKATIYKQLIESRALVVMEINCTKDIIMSNILRGKTVDLPDVSFSEYLKTSHKKRVHPDDYEKTVKFESIENIIENYNNGITEITNFSRMHAYSNTDSYKWLRTSISISKDEKKGDILAVVTVFDDIDSHLSKQSELSNLADRDSLLGAYNKAATERIISEQLKSNPKGVVFMIDLDNFKLINDNFGHKYGDEVLIEVYEKIKKNFRSGDIIGRIGGDEFMAYINNFTDIEDIKKKADKICSSIEKDYIENDICVTLSSSVGVSIAPVHGTTFDTLYNHADIAMYKIKKANKNGYSIYSV